MNSSTTAAKRPARQGALLSARSEGQDLAAFLADLLPETARRSPEAASFLRLAVAALDPLAELANGRSAETGPTGGSPVAALIFALKDLTPGTGPHVWVTMAIEILTGQRASALGTS